MASSSIDYENVNVTKMDSQKNCLRLGKDAFFHCFFVKCIAYSLSVYSNESIGFYKIYLFLFLYQFFFLSLENLFNKTLQVNYIICLDVNCCIRNEFVFCYKFRICAKNEENSRNFINFHGNKKKNSNIMSKNLFQFQFLRRFFRKASSLHLRDVALHKTVCKEEW